MLSVVILENIDIMLAEVLSSKLLSAYSRYRKNVSLKFPEEDVLSCSHTSVRNKIMEAGG